MAARDQEVHGQQEQGLVTLVTGVIYWISVLEREIEAMKLADFLGSTCKRLVITSISCAQRLAEVLNLAKKADLQKSTLRTARAQYAQRMGIQ